MILFGIWLVKTLDEDVLNNTRQRDNTIFLKQSREARLGELFCFGIQFQIVEYFHLNYTRNLVVKIELRQISLKRAKWLQPLDDFLYSFGTYRKLRI